MKSIELKKVKEELVVNGQRAELELHTLDIIETAVNAPSEGGMNASDLYSRIKILDAVREVRNSKKSVKELLLDDADYTKLGEYANACKWSIVSRTILDFVKQFEVK